MLKKLLLYFLNDFLVTFVGHLYFFVVSQPPPPPTSTHPPSLTATICLNPSLNSRYQNVNTACFALLFSCSVQEANMEERGSHLDIDEFPCTAVTIMIDISSLEHVLKCLTCQNILTELTLDSSLESLDIMFFSLNNFHF